MNVIVVIKKEKELVDNEIVDYTKQSINAIIVENSFISISACARLMNDS